MTALYLMTIVAGVFLLLVICLRLARINDRLDELLAARIREREHRSNDQKNRRPRGQGKPEEAITWTTLPARTTEFGNQTAIKWPNDATPTSPTTSS